MDDEQEHLPYARSLAALEREIAHGMETLAYPSADWVVGVPAPDGTTALDCAVIGGGQCGLSVAAGLRRERVMRMEVFDAAPAGREGPWLTFARMAMLRTPKVLTGPDMGMPALSFRAWWEAQYGAEGWEKLFRIPRESWMAYLCWYRRVLDLPVTNGWRLIDLTPTADDKLLRLTFSTPQGHVTRYARTCVLATGAAGSGGFSIPDFVARAVPADRVWHANDTFDLAVMKGQRIGVLGAGASAFDISAAALHAGARSVDLCFRRPSLPRTNPRRWMENAGFLGNYVDLPDTLKWRYMLGLRQIGQGPPKPTYDAACALSGFHIHPATPWTHVKWTGQDIVVRSGERQFVFDALVTATGIRVDFSERPELRSLHAHAAFWHDRHTPGADEHCPELGLFPYLDRCGAFTARVAGQAPWLSRVLTATRSCTLSLGPVAASNSALKYVAPRLVDGVRRQLLRDQAAHDWSIFAQRDHTELVAT